jgi:hypothetical protein
LNIFSSRRHHNLEAAGIHMNKYIAELSGTFIPVLCGTGAVVINKQSNGIITLAGIAITFGLVVNAIIYTLGDVCGAHMNPAVTHAFTIAKRFRLTRVLTISSASWQVLSLPVPHSVYSFPPMKPLAPHFLQAPRRNLSCGSS